MMVPVYQPLSYADLLTAKAVLHGADIEYVVTNEFGSEISLPSASGAATVEVFVGQADLEKATVALAELLTGHDTQE